MCRVDAGIGADAIVVILERRALVFLLLSAIHPAGTVLRPPSLPLVLVTFAAIGLPSLMTIDTGAGGGVWRVTRLEEEEVEEGNEASRPHFDMTRQ